MFNIVALSARIPRGPFPGASGQVQGRMTGHSNGGALIREE
jgi:hypothetical protein